jgi:hypothetical protein
VESVIPDDQPVTAGRKRAFIHQTVKVSPFPYRRALAFLLEWGYSGYTSVIPKR